MKLGSIVLFIISISTTGCGLLLDAIPIDSPCKISINQHRIKSSCGLINGIQFEKLEVIRLNSDGFPNEYTILERFDLYNAETPEIQTYWPDKVYFTKTNGHYRWKTDSVNLHVIVGEDGERLLLDSIQKTNLNDQHISEKSSELCPVKFTPKTWYFCFSSLTRSSSRYIYVDAKMKFHVYNPFR